MRKLRHTAYAYYFKENYNRRGEVASPDGLGDPTPTMSRLVVGNADLRSLRNTVLRLYTKNSCWLPQRVRQPTAISSECIV